ncbi:MAG: response regulator [Acidobacteriota bacterium]
MVNGNILVVEDSDTERQAIVKVLTDHGFRATMARNGDEAMAQIQQERPALVLLDVVMPGPNGYQVCRKLKSDPTTRDIKVVIVTSKGLEADRFWGFKQGADDYVSKPFSPDNLVSTVRKQLAS